MTLSLATCQVRSWTHADIPSLVRHANNRNVWLNVRDRFPFPYTVGDGRRFIRKVRGERPETTFAIALDGEAVGGIGFVLQNDVDRTSAEMGYWLGEPFWGRGIVADALQAVSRYALDAHPLTRLFAVTFAYNVRSVRVLEKAGYVLEGRLRRSAIKDGQVVDQLQYALVR